MSNEEPQRREQALGLIATFCKKPYREHGKKRDSGPYKGWHHHDWGHLVQRVYRTFYDQALSIPDATLAAKLLRKEFPNQPDWNERVGAQNAQARILALIEAGIAPFAPARESS